jgi:hypothetical protein
MDCTCEPARDQSLSRPDRTATSGHGSGHSYWTKDAPALPNARDGVVRSDFVLGENHVNPEKWQPLIYNFRHYFGLGIELGKTFRAEV